MSILIKGMEMPEMRQAYVGLIICWDGEVFPFIPPQGYELGESVATAIPVPPHGRLIDADMMEKECCHGCKNEFHKYENCIDCVLANTPTIIPAEEGEK